MSPDPAPHRDIVQGDWVDRFLPSALRPYARLLRLDRPIGTWLLFLPCCWSTVAASPGQPDLGMLFLFALGSIVMRGAGCIVNDLYDQELDQRVVRTQTRPLASGQLTRRQAFIFLGCMLLLGALILSFFNALTFLVATASLLLVFTYPYMKRITWWPQLFLGLAFNWGALVGWTAVQGTLDLPALFLYVGGIFWTLGYDTIYAHQDKADDALVGMKSLALKWGDASPLWVGMCFAAAFLLWLEAGHVCGARGSFYMLMPVLAAHFIWQVHSWNMNDGANCLQRFRSNRDAGFIFFVALLVGI